MSEVAVSSDQVRQSQHAVRRPRIPVLAIAGWLVIAVHVAAWAAAAAFLGRPLLASQSIWVLTAGTAMLGTSAVRARRVRTMLALSVMVFFLAGTILRPLPAEYAGNHFMGDGTDFAEHREKFETNIPWAANDRALHFKAHLGDAVLAGIDRAFGRTAASPATAYEVLSRLGGVLFVAELLLVLVVSRWSRRACRFAAVALALPLSLTFFGYYEVGYLAASIGAFPLLALALSRRSPGLLHGSGALQGLHAALHGFGILGIAGGVLAALSEAPARWSRWATALQYAAFAAALYLGWVVLYVVLFKLSIAADQASAAVAMRGWSEAYYFDRRLVNPLSTLRGFAEVGVTSFATGVPLLVAALAMTRPRARAAGTAIAYSLPALIFLIAWWPSLGVHRDMDLLLGAFGAISAAAWVASRRMATAVTAVVLLMLVHVYFWSTIGNRSLDRVWIGE